MPPIAACWAVAVWMVPFIAQPALACWPNAGSLALVPPEVGPVWRGGAAGEAELLAACYCASIRLAAEQGLQSLAFPAISCGVYGYPLDQACAIAVDTLIACLPAAPVIRQVLLVAYSLDVADSLAQALRFAPLAE